MTAQEAKSKSEQMLAKALVEQTSALVAELRKEAPIDAPTDEPPPEGVDDDAPPVGDDAPPPSSETPPPAEEGSEEWSPEEVEAALRAIPPEQLPMWQSAIEKVMGEQGGDADDGAGPVDAPPESGETEALKSELSKAERRIADLERSVASLTKSQPPARPQRRAATGPAMAPARPPAASLSKAEIRRRLDNKAINPSLSKSDRDLINNFVLGRDTSVASIAHLLKD